MYSHREESALRSALDAGLRGQKAAPSDRRRVVLVSLFAMQARCRGAAQAAREQAERARAIAERLERAANAHEVDAAKIRGLAARVKREGLPVGVEQYCPRGWLELTG
jgi:hypothetical protein